MAGWGKLVAGVVLGAAGALYATNEDLRKNLPGRARDLPELVRRRLRAAAAAAREGSRARRVEILRELEARDYGGPGESGRELPTPPRAVEAPPASMEPVEPGAEPLTGAPGRRIEG